MDLHQTGVLDAARMRGSPHWSWQLQKTPVDWRSGIYRKDLALQGVAILEDVLVSGIFFVIDEKNRTIITDSTYEDAERFFPQSSIKRSGSRYCYIPSSEPEYITDRSILLGGHNNHYHMLLNWLPKIECALRSGLCDDLRRWKLVVSANIPKVYLEIIFSFGFQEDQIIHHRLGDIRRFRSLMVPTIFDRHAYCDEQIHFLRNRLAPIYYEKTHLEDRSRIYISRQGIGTPKRRVANQDALDVVLSDYGFSTLRLEDMTFSEQVNAFSNAEIIIGGHGAGLANLPFSKKAQPLYCSNTNSGVNMKLSHMRAVYYAIS